MTTLEQLRQAIRDRASGQSGPETDARIEQLARRAGLCERCAVRDHKVTETREDSHVRVYSDRERESMLTASGAKLLSLAHGGQLVRVCETHYSEHAHSIWTEVIEPLSTEPYSPAWELCPDWGSYAAEASWPQRGDSEDSHQDNLRREEDG